MSSKGPILQLVLKLLVATDRPIFKPAAANAPCWAKTHQHRNNVIVIIINRSGVSGGRAVTESRDDS